MAMEFLKSIGGKIVTGLVALAVVAGAIAWWQTDPGTRREILSTSGRLAGWGLIVLTLPWLSFALIGWTARLQSNPAGAILILAMTTIEAVLLARLMRDASRTPTTWSLFAAAVLLAGVYNLFACDWIAEKVE